MNTKRYKKQSNQIKHQQKKSYINENSKKFNNLKYKPKAQIKATTIEKTENTEKPTYAEILRKTEIPPGDKT